MDLILVRHGKAEEYKETIVDDQRALTAEGRRKLVRTLPSLGILIRNMNKIQLWTSPLKRAAQTADVIARLFGIEDVQTCDFAADGDFQALIASLESVRSSSTIILVGHEPHLSTWCQLFCGSLLPFKKGSAACIRINGLDPVTSELSWFFQPQTLARLGENLLGNQIGHK